ncbi:MAG: hypothetical protein R2699_14625 [Acidimicrobiales bacterium]
MERFDAATTLALVEQRRARHAPGPDDVRAALALDDAGPRLRRRVVAAHGAARRRGVGAGRAGGCLDWWGDVLVEYWAAPKAGSFVDAADWRAGPGTVGRPIPGHEVVVTDEGRNELPPHTDGILWCRPRVADVFRYHGDEAKTAATF